MRAVPAIAAVLIAATALAAQTGPDPRARLAEARNEAVAAQMRAASLDQQARQADDLAAQARLAQAAAAARVQAAEAQLAGAEARLGGTRAALRAQQQRLAAREQPAVGLLAAVQTMARRPAAAALVQPGNVTDMIHARALLATMGTHVRQQTAGLRAELARTAGLRRAAEHAVDAVLEGRRLATLERRQFARLELDHRRRSASLAGAAREEGARAAAIAASSRGLDDLVRGLGRDAALRDRLAALPGPLPRPARIGAALPTDERQVARPALPYRMPVLGPVVRGFGETLPSGARARGISIGARPGALVVAPAAGRVTFAGLFRGYGVIAIVDHGGGYTSLMTGLGASMARVGDTVAQGGALGRAGPNGISVELRQDGRTVDVSQFVA